LDYTYYGRILSANGKDSLAVEKLTIAAQKDSLGAAELYSDLATLYSKMKRYPDAIAMYQKKIAMGKAITNDYFRMGQSYYNLKEFGKADTAFSNIITAQPNLIAGYLWRARSNSNLDPDSKLGLAKPFYEELATRIEADTLLIAKNPKELMEAYKYLGFYYYQAKDYPNARIWWEKVKSRDPADKQAEDALKDMKGK